MIIAIIYLLIGLCIMTPNFCPRARENVEDMLVVGNMSRTRAWISYVIAYFGCVLLWLVIVGAMVYNIIQEHHANKKES